MVLAYLGFNQEAGIRRFRFECQIHSPRPATAPRRIVRFVVSAEMSLFLQYSIPIQEGPAICLQILTDTLAGSDENEVASASYAITKEHLSTFVSARTLVAEAKAARRKPRPPFKPSSSSQLKLPPRIN